MSGSIYRSNVGMHPRVTMILGLVMIAVVCVSLTRSENDAAAGRSPESHIPPGEGIWAEGVFHLEPGRWVFEGIPWTIAQSIVASDDIKDISIVAGPDTLTTTVSRLDQHVMTLVRQTCAVQQAGTARRRYVLARRDLDVQVVTHVVPDSDVEVPCMIRISWPANDDRRTQLTLIRTDESPPAKELLPHPDGVASWGQRVDRRNEVQYEILRTTHSAQTLKAFWKNHGWSIRDAPHRHGPSSSTPVAVREVFWCRSDSATVEVTVRQQADGSRLIVLRNVRQEWES